MSLVSTYVEADDGHWYKDPTLLTSDWFVCYDDDEPIEVVIKEGGPPLDVVLKVLAATGYVLVPYGRGRGLRARRDFDGKMVPALGYFVEHAHGRMPASFVGTHDGKFTKRPDREMVYYPGRP